MARKSKLLKRTKRTIKNFFKSLEKESPKVIIGIALSEIWDYLIEVLKNLQF